MYFFFFALEVLYCSEGCTKNKKIKIVKSPKRPHPPRVSPDYNGRCGVPEGGGVSCCRAGGESLLGPEGWKMRKIYTLRPPVVLYKSRKLSLSLCSPCHLLSTHRAADHPCTPCVHTNPFSPSLYSQAQQKFTH